MKRNLIRRLVPALTRVYFEPLELLRLHDRKIHASFSFSLAEHVKTTRGRRLSSFVEPNCFGCAPKKIQGDARGRRLAPLFVLHMNLKVQFQSH